MHQTERKQTNSQKTITTMHATANFLLLVVAATFLTVTHAMTVAGVATECLPHERDALLAFKRGITYDPLHLLASWRRVEDCCRWSGVRCNNRTGGHIVELRLRGVPTYEVMELSRVGLVGQITPSLLSLERLEHLDLSWNFLERPTGRLPKFLGSMNNLRYLNLSGIPFIGMLPPQLGNLSKLHYLDLSYTEFTGMLPPQLGNLSKLHYLDLSDYFSELSTDLSWLTNLPSLHYLNLNGINLNMVDDWPHVVNMIPSLRVLCLSFCGLQSANQSLSHLNLTKLEELDLSMNHFDHPVASCWFWNLTSLKHLALEDTFLYGQFPNALGDMASLQVFDFSNNDAAVVIPPNLRNLCNLEILDLEWSLSSGNITKLFESLSHCPSKKLQQLHLAGNNFTGTLPTGIGQFTSLVTFDLNHNKLTGPVPSEITMLTNLTTMYLSSNDLDGVITEEHFAGLHSLENIDLSDNHLKIAVSPQWSPPFRLKRAYFASCQMGPQFPAWLQRLVDIKVIDISSNGITDELPDWFSTALSKVTFLDIYNNRISGGLPPNMETMSLRRFYLDSNQITGQIPPLPRNLTYLTMSKNALSGRVPESICKSRELEILDLADNLMEGEFPQCSLMKDLMGLFLSNNRFSGKFPSFLQSCPNLFFLDLSRNNFSGRLPMWIGDIVSLQYLQLSYNKFYGNIPSSITNLSFLLSLNLASNSLSGVIPWHLSNLTMTTAKYDLPLCGVSLRIPRFHLSAVTKRQELYYAGNCMFNIDLSSNCLTGGIPEDIASLELISLNLSFNFLRGKIPSKIGSMQSLESLDLSRNKLFGEIPLSLSNLTYLSYLDLSYNNLSGRIPSGSQLDTLYANNPFMYSGNNGLCGPPLQTNCSGGIASKQGDGDHKRTSAFSPDPMFCFHLGLGSGFVVGLWVIFCTMLFKKTWRIAYFRLFDKVYDKIYVFVVVTWAGLAQKTATN